MKFSEINPFARYIRYLKITENSQFGTVLPRDCRLFYAKKGVGKIEIDGKILEMPTGSAVYINSFVPYTLLKSDVRYLAINFDFTHSFSHLNTPLPPVPIERQKEFSPVEKTTFEDTFVLDRYLFIQNAFELSDIFEKAEDEFVKKAPLYTVKNSIQITYILIYLIRQHEFDSIGEKGFDADKIAEYIREHLTEDISNITLAEIFHFHKNYLSSQFCKHFGKPVHSYILEMRIMKAISLLEAGRSNIGEIARKSGFSDANYFSRYFKKVTGTSPRHFMSHRNTVYEGLGSRD